MAEPLWEPDGTQPPPPFQAWEDPVSGLVTGSAYESEPIKIDLAAPGMPDLSEVRRAVDAVLSDDEPIARAIPTQRRQPQPPRVTPGLVPTNPRAGWPRSPSVRQLAGLRPRTPGAGSKANPSTRVRRPAGQRRQRGSSAGFAAILILILVVIVILVTAINSLMDTLSSIFN